MKKYEYQVLNVSTIRTGLTAELEWRGMDGWEMITIDQGIIYFKRELVDYETSS